MESEQKDKPSFSLKQIFDEGAFVLGWSSLLSFFQNSLGSATFSSSFSKKIFFLFLFNTCCIVFLASLYVNLRMQSLLTVEIMFVK